MPKSHSLPSSNLLPPAMLAVLLLSLGGCAVGPDFSPPVTAAPDSWSSWHSGDPGLRVPLSADAGLPERWWDVFQDPVLDELQQRALAAGPDLQTATLHFAQARAARQGQNAQKGPTVDLDGTAVRQRLSEFGAGTRLIDALTTGNTQEQIIQLLSEPFNLYQAGFDASWEIDLWGRVRRSIEAADADVVRQAALLDQARLSLLSEVARNYFELRGVERRLALTRQDVAALEERLGLIEARVKGGVTPRLDLLRQRNEVLALRAQVSALLAQQTGLINQIALLVGERPGALQGIIAAAGNPEAVRLPDLALGVPSELALRRPDIRASEAQLRSATAKIGVAQAQLYPTIRIGAGIGLESLLADEFTNWGSRTWSIGPTLSLPIFDGGRRKAEVQLRELQQQEAAVAYQRTVLLAWREIDDALTGYAAELQQQKQFEERVATAGESYELAQAQFDGGSVDFTAVLDTQRASLQARIDLAASRARLASRFVAINKALGNAASTTNQ
jgi:NodT family efflux transporter outer membrane factor (OMF) lipoprotein